MPGESTLDAVERIRARTRWQQLRLFKHATKRMDLRRRTLIDIQQIILAGEVIREYPNEKPYPEYLFLGYPQGPDDPCYVVVASNDETIIVTIHDYDRRCTNQITGHGGKLDEVCILQRGGDPPATGYCRAA